MKTLLIITACPLFLISLAAHIYVKLRLRPGPDLDDYYHEFEHQHPQYVKFTKWSQITFIAAAIAALILFIATII